MARTTTARAPITTAATDRLPGKGGRPTAEAAAALADRITAAASVLFMQNGYAATSIEAIAASAGVSKRTFYARFDTKGAVFLAVVGRLVQQWMGGLDDALDPARPLAESLLAIARTMLDVTLTPEALALHALVTAEAMRFPELGQGLRAGGADTGIVRIAALLRHHWPCLDASLAAQAAGQFQALVVHNPQRRAVVMGDVLDPAARDAWCRDAVRLFLGGMPGLSAQCTAG